MTQSQLTTNTEPFSLLFSATNHKPTKLKKYKQGISKENSDHVNWKAKIQEEIESLISNDI